MKTVGFRDFVRFLRFKGKKDHGDVCSTCGTSQWHVQLPDDSEPMPTEMTLGIGYYSRAREENAEFSPLVKGALPIIAIVCDNCGMTRLYATKVVYEWVKENPEDDE